MCNGYIMMRVNSNVYPWNWKALVWQVEVLGIYNYMIEGAEIKLRGLKLKLSQ